MADKSQRKQQDELFDEYKPLADQKKGMDILNLAEFPLTALTERLPKGVKTLRFEDQYYDKESQKLINQQVTVTGGDAFGLPQAIDDDVITALIQLTKRAGSRKTVTFSRYEIIEMLGWKHDTYYYKRIEEALDRWVAVTLKYKNAWWAGKEDGYTSETFHILESVTTTKTDSGKTRDAFVWSDIVYKEITEGRLKSLDMEIHNKLKSHLAKRLYRWLDKRFHWTPRIRVDITKLICKKFGLWDGQPIAALKRKLKPAINELENIGFIKKMDYKARFDKERVGEWFITIERAKMRTNQQDLLEEEVIDVEEVSDTYLNLRAFGVSESMIARLMSEYPKEYLDDKIDALEFLQSKGSDSIENPAGFLMESIKNDYAPPKDWKPADERAKDAEIQAKAKEREQSELMEQGVEDALNALRSAVDREKREIAGHLATMMDKATNKKLRIFLKKDAKEGFDLPPKIDLTQQVLSGQFAGGAESLFIANHFEDKRLEFFEQHNPGAFEDLDLQQIASDSGSFEGKLRQFLERAIESFPEL